MEITLSDIEARILACLIEKEITTPDYYPLTLNSLTSACNQKSNRSPVVSYEETTVVRGLDSLRQKGLAEKILKADSRVPKYQHTLRERITLSNGAVAVLCELMLRGPQTTGELRTRADRMYSFEGLADVEETLDMLMQKDEPLVIRLPRQPGRKEPRYMHLLSGTPSPEEVEAAFPEEKAAVQVRAENERIARLEEDLAALRRELDALSRDFRDLKSQLE